MFPQHEHARVSAVLAGAWSDAFAPIRLPREAFVLGVARHDRGYGEHDADQIGSLPPGRWLAIQERGFAPTGEDTVVDLVVALHVRRLVSSARDADSRLLLDAMDAELPGLVLAAGVPADDASAADRITDLCDRISFDLCLEEPASGAVAVLDAGGSPLEVRYHVDGHGKVTLAPWPLETDRLTGTVQGFVAERYPAELDPVPAPFTVEPAEGAR